MSTLSHELFDHLLNGSAYSANVDPYQCDLCDGTLRESNANKLVCDICGAVKEGADQLGDHERPSSSTVSIIVGKGKKRTYNLTNTNTEQRAAAILADLDAKAKTYRERHNQEAVPRTVLINAARQYAEMQELYPELCGARFIRRGDVRDNIIAALIYDKANEQRIGRKKEVIAELMDLKKNGFSEGMIALRNASLSGIVALSNNDPTEGFASRYLDTLGILNDTNLKFVCGIIDYISKYNISPSSQLSSKIVGVIWLLIKSSDLSITMKDLEHASDNTRENTITMLHKTLMRNIDKFIPIYRAYGVPYPAKK